MKLIITFCVCILPILVFCQNIEIPDSTFLQVLIDQGVDVNNDNIIQYNEAENLTSLDVSFKNIEDLEGIQYFINLTALNCLNNKLTSIDLTSLENLTSLICSSNKISSLNLSKNINLEVLLGWNNFLEEIDLSNNINLKIIQISNNNLTNLNIENNTLIEQLTISENNLESIDLSQNSSLIKLDCHNSNLNFLDLSNNSNLEILSCQENNLNVLDLSNNLSLTSINCNKNNIDQIDVSLNIDLIYLNCSENNLNALDLTNNHKLISLFCEKNNLNVLDLSNNHALKTLISRNNLLNHIDLTNNTALEDLKINNNNIPEIGLSNNINIKTCYLSENPINEIDVTNNLQLEDLNIRDCDIEEIDLSQNLNLKFLNASNTTIKTLDLSTNSLLESLSASFASNLHYLNINNGTKINFLVVNDNNSPLTICLDEEEIEYVISKTINQSTILLTDCDLGLNDVTYDISGTIKFSDSESCVSNNQILDDLHFNVNNGIESIYYPIYNQGDFLIKLPEDEYNITPLVENRELFHFEPDSLEIFLSSANSPYVQDFCFWPKATGYADVLVSIVPIDLARPGFEVKYKIILENKGNISANGTLEINYPSLVSTYVSSSQVMIDENGILSLEYSNLNPFERREISLTMLLNSPVDDPPLIDGNLCYEVNVESTESDFYLPNNQFKLIQEVVNSFDPNDKMCLQGATLLDEKLGEYIYYKIRFENTGTASAVNIVIHDKIDSLSFLNSSVKIVDSSHPVLMETDGELVTFIFRDILLPFQEGINTGYVIFKVKTLNYLNVGHKLENTSDIYFDFNYPIRTNTYVTEIVTDMDGDGFNNLEDCNDNNNLVYPGQLETPYNGIDDDCNEVTLDDDLDQDGFLLIDDCDDENDDINPNAIEIPYNGVDDDCNEVTLDDDLDQDGFLLIDDCDDENPFVNPDSEEIPNNGIDDNCDGHEVITSVHELSDATITIYPNPTSDIIYIDANEDIDLKISICDLQGQLILSTTNNNINIKSFPYGTYFMIVQDLKSKKIIVEKLVKID